MHKEHRLRKDWQRQKGSLRFRQSDFTVVRITTTSEWAHMERTFLNAQDAKEWDGKIFHGNKCGAMKKSHGDCHGRSGPAGA
eukprot:12914714-Prorocentrum_lima.AAC.1